jgi:deubiquitinase DESI2
LLKSILKLDMSLFVAIAADDGLGSNASIVEGSDEDDLDQLLRTPNSDVVSSRDKTFTPGRDSF